MPRAGENAGLFLATCPPSCSCLRILKSAHCFALRLFLCSLYSILPTSDFRRRISAMVSECSCELLILLFSSQAHFTPLFPFRFPLALMLSPDLTGLFPPHWFLLTVLSLNHTRPAEKASVPSVACIKIVLPLQFFLNAFHRLSENICFLLLVCTSNIFFLCY